MVNAYAPAPAPKQITPAKINHAFIIIHDTPNLLHRNQPALRTLEL
jgi:hypothetical protein